MIKKDYSLLGKDGKLALENGLAEADWYQSPVPRETMRKLMERKDFPAIRDTLIWFGLMISLAVLAIQTWGTWWSLCFFMLYGLLYASSSDSRWHESSHGTAFKTDWLNNLLYEIASFMVMRESTIWRWSHARHHSDTSIVGRDPEIAVPTPSNLRHIFMAFFNLRAIPNYFSNVLLHCTHRLTEEESDYIPESEVNSVYFKAKIYLAIYTAIIVSCIYTSSILPLMLIGLPNLYGAWLMPVYGLTQHAGMPENVLDHRLNCRTINMNWLNRYLYWNMNYHVEHHMFPLVPYHALPKLHEVIKNDLPTPYASIYSAYKEIIPAVIKQVKDPSYSVKRDLPESVSSFQRPDDAHIIMTTNQPDNDGWIDLTNISEIAIGEVSRFDHGHDTFAVYRTEEKQFYATEGMCSHGNTHLSTGLIVKGSQIECPKHNGRFDVRDGSPTRNLACVGLKTYPVKSVGNRIFINVLQGEMQGVTSVEEYEFEVVSNQNVATYIKELVLKSTEKPITFIPGDYLHLKIPAYQEFSFSDISVDEEYQHEWQDRGVFNLKAVNNMTIKRNYSLANNPEKENLLRFNVRIALPEKDSKFNPGVGSSYVFNLKPGDKVTADGPYGDFHIKQSNKEMIYIGGGAGMAPMRSHLSWLFDTQKTERKVSYWYGARTIRELFYQDYFEELQNKYENFSFHLALSEPEDDGKWNSYTGYIHDVLDKNYLQTHSNISNVEFYLCGPPPMIVALKKLLSTFGVKDTQIALDEF